MHLADGIIDDPASAIGLSVVGACGVAWAMRRVNAGPAAPRLAWAGTVGAFVLAAQAINVPLLPGVSVHVIGSSLLTLLLGPGLALLVLTCVLLVQALLLGDGGVTMLGVNAVTLALLPVSTMAIGQQVARGRGPRAHGCAIVLGTLAGNLSGAATLAWVLVEGAGAPPALTWTWLVGVQAVAGLLEGVLTLWAWKALKQRFVLERTGAQTTRRLSLDAQSLAGVGGPDLGPLTWRWTAVALGILLALIPWSSQRPDALQVVVEQLQP